MNIEFLENGISVNDKFLSLEEITHKVNEVKAKKHKLGLMIISWPGGRGWDGATEKFVGPLKNLKRMKEILKGKTIYFGEIAGKHSEVYGTLDESDMVIHEDVAGVQTFLKECPGGHQYDHSFLHQFLDDATCGGYEDEFDEGELTEEIVKEFGGLMGLEVEVL